MSVEHFVKQGECLSSIAYKYGFGDYRTIYNHPANATFKTKRPSPNVISPGDIVIIPDKSSKTEPCATSARHLFTVNRPITKFRIVLASDSGEVYSDKRYKLTVEGRVCEGKTDSTGMVEQVIPADARTGELVIFLSDGDGIDGYTFPLDFGALDPPDQLSGAQARLRNLGYECETLNGVMDSSTQAALEAFQGQNGLNITGALDHETVETLRKLHEE